MTTGQHDHPNRTLLAHIDALKLSFVREHYLQLAQQATEQGWDPLTCLLHRLQGEVLQRQMHSVKRRIHLARFPVIKTLERFHWTGPRAINRVLVQHVSG